MRRLLFLLTVALVVTGFNSEAQVQRPPRITLEILPDDSQLVTVRRVLRDDKINPELSIDGQELELAPGDTIVFQGPEKGENRHCSCNFSQPARETSILYMYSPEINLILKNCNLRNCTLPAHAVRIGGMHAQYTNYLVEDVDIETDTGHKLKQKYRDIADVHGPPTVKNHHINRVSPQILNKTITPELKELIITEATAMAQAYVLLDPAEQAEWSDDDGVWNLFLAIGQVLIDEGVLPCDNF